MIKYRLYILAIIYVAVILCCITVSSSRGCYTHNKNETSIANLVTAKFYFYDKHATDIGRLKQGDLILFAMPGTAKEYKVRRLLGKPGDQVAFKDGVFQVNGTPYQLPLNTTAQAKSKEVLEPVTVPSGTIFVIADDFNSMNFNGRDFLVPQYKIKGKFLKSIFKEESL
jgi:signal peptidase I